MADERTAKEIAAASAVTDERVEDARSKVDDALLLALLAAALWRGKVRAGRKAGYYWDAEELVFRDADGNVVPIETVLEALDSGLEPFRQDVRSSVKQLADEEIDTDTFQRDLEETTALALIVGGALAVGGWRRFRATPTHPGPDGSGGPGGGAGGGGGGSGPAGGGSGSAGSGGPGGAGGTLSPRERVEEAIAEELPFASDFADEIDDGLAPGRIGPRAEQYVESAHRTHERIRRAEWIDHVAAEPEPDDTEGTQFVDEEMRTLHSVQPCRDCPGYANRWEPLGTLPDIGQECECHSNCKCRFHYRRRVISVMASAKKTELSYNDVQSRLITAIRASEPRHDSTYIRDVYSDRVIYRDWEDEKTYERTYSIDADGLVTLGDPSEVTERTVYEAVAKMAAFSMVAGAESKGSIPWQGTIFRAGSYPKQKIDVSAADIDAAVAAFQPVKLNVEHSDSIFTGRFGELTRIWRDGEELKGEVRTPAWFRDEVVEGGKLKVSTEWDRASKLLVGLATSLNPQVEAAELTAVFSKGEAQFVGRRNSKKDQASIQGIHDHAASLGADCAAKAKMAREDSDMSEAKQSGWDRFKAFFASLNGEERKELGLPETPAATTTPTSLTAEMSADDKARFAALEAEVARLKGDKKGEVATAAALFADEQIKAGKATPAARNQLIARFTEAAEDDIDAPRKVSFSVGAETKEGTRVDRLRAEFAAMQGSQLLSEAVEQPGVAVLSATTTATGTDPVALAKQSAESYAADRNKRNGLSVAK